MEHGAKPHLKHLTEYFALLYEFSKMGEDESQFLISIHAISTMVNFYLGQKSVDYVRQLFVLNSLESLSNFNYMINHAVIVLDSLRLLPVLNLARTSLWLMLGNLFKNGIDLTMFFVICLISLIVSKLITAKRKDTHSSQKNFELL